MAGSMIGRTLSHYKILDEISRGGMGIVYRAVDLKLNREVAVKVLPPELTADEERRRRFVQEAQAASALEHPHIAVIHEIDEVEGVTFIAMELIRGEKLRDLIARRRMPLARSLDLAIEVAEGLARAHEKGIVHRDLKPANIMVTEDGHAKIIDFGLAKLVEPLGGDRSDVETALQKETDPGKVMGTVSYMSPEQASGDKVDHRSDIFSCGIVLHEMISGKPPFQGPTGLDTLHAILRELAPRLPPLGPEVSGEAAFDLQRILDKCLEKEPEGRYQGMRDLVVDLRAARRRLESGSLALATSAVGPLEQAARRGLLRRLGERRLLAGVVVAFLVMAGALAFWLRPSSRKAPPGVSRPSLAVLYFENNTGEPSLDWLRTALTDMLITDLSQSPHMEVLSTDRLYQILKEMNRLDERVTSFEVVQQVAERAQVNTVLLGSFVKAGENIRISIKVQEARTGRIISSDRVEGMGEESLFPMVDDLTRRIKTKFDIPQVADAELDRDLKDVTTASIEAYRYYAEGINLFERMKQEEAIPLFEKAVELDPGFAMALGKLSAIHFNLGHPKESLEYRKRAFEHVSRLSARERYYVEGHYYWTSYNTYARALQAFQKAVELYPDHGSARNNLALMYYQLERYPEAIEHFEVLRQRGEKFAGAYGNLAECYSAQGELEQGYQVLQDFLRENPESSYGHKELGEHLIRWGRWDEALEAFQRAESLGPGRLEPESGRWQVYVLREEWEKAVAAAHMLGRSRDPFWKWVSFVSLAQVALYRGHSRDGLNWLKQAAGAFPEPGFLTSWGHSYSALLLIATNQAATALEEAQTARREGKGHPVELLTFPAVALAQASLGQVAEAEKTAQELRQKAELLPGERSERRYHQLMGELALARGDTAVAVAELSRAESLLPRRGLAPPPPDHVPVWFALGSAHMAAGADAEAARYFQRVVESTTEHLAWPIPYVRSFYFLGKIEEKQGNRDKARDYYRRFLGYWREGDLDRERVEEALRKISG